MPVTGKPTDKELEQRIRALETASIKNEPAEEKSQWQLSDIFNFFLDPAFIIDTDGKVVFWNKAIEEITGIKAADILGKDNYEYALPFYSERRPMLIDLVLTPRKEIEAGYVFIQKRDNFLEGEAYLPVFRKKETYLYCRAAILHDSKGKVIGAIESIRNITERKLLESQLRQAMKMEAICTLSGGIAHDFNNILSAVIGYSEMGLLEPKENDRLQRYFDQIYRAGKKAEDLVNQLITFSRRKDEKPYPLRIDPMVKEVLKLIRTTLPLTIEIQSMIQPSPCTVLANPEHIYQILMNLCTNAVSAIGSGKGILKVELAPEEIKPGDDLINHGLNSGMYARLGVSDTGQGMAPEIINKIFDPFFTIRNPGEGLGMGLSIVYEIVKRYGGAITVQSKVGRGTLFNVYLPLLIKVQE